MLLGRWPNLAFLRRQDRQSPARNLMGMQMMYRLVLSATMFTTLLTGSVLFPHVAHAATYYVATNGSDSNPGSQAQPFRTINKGLKVLASGDTLYIRGGKYNEAINPVTGAIPNGGGSWATATIIAGYPGETVTLAPTAGSSHAGGSPDEGAR